MDEKVPDFERLGQMGFALALQLLRNREDAADAVQDALQRVVDKRNLFDPARGQLRAWFMSIVRNRCRDQLRKQKNRVPCIADPSMPQIATEKRPDEIVEHREMAELLKKELLDMPTNQRELILLRDYHQLGYAEIAQVLSIKPGTVMSRLHRSRLELKRRMQKYR